MSIRWCDTRTSLKKQNDLWTPGKLAYLPVPSPFLEYLSARYTDQPIDVHIFLMRIDGRRLFIVIFYLLTKKSEWY